MDPLRTWLLNTVYLGLLVMLSPLLLWAAIRKGKYREGAAEKLLGRVQLRPADSPLHIWLHAVSVGEVNMLPQLLQQLQSHYPSASFHITTTTKAGNELAQKKFAEHIVSYAPLDFSWAVHQAYQRIRPDVVLLVELELWPNLISHAKKHGAKIAIVNGRLSEKSFRGYRRIALIVQGVLQQIDLIVAQDETYAKRFLELGARRVAVSGSIKFDGISVDRNNHKTIEFAELAGIVPEDLVWLAGSTQSGEESIIMEAYQKALLQVPNLKLLLVPRHPHRFDEVSQLLKNYDVTSVRRSRLGHQQATKSQVLLVDSVGELSAWWGIADIAFVGGSLGNRGGQNMIEPAAYGAAVCFGPNTWNFKDIVERLLDHSAAKVVTDANSLANFVIETANSPELREELGSNAQQVVLSQQGATARTLELLSPLIGHSKPPARQKAA